MHLVLAAPDSREALRRELRAAVSTDSREVLPGLFALEGEPEPPAPRLAFARQQLPAAEPVSAPSIRGWAELLFEKIAPALPEHVPWAVHLVPFEDVPEETRVGARAWHSRSRSGSARTPAVVRPSKSGVASRCRYISEALDEVLQKKRRHLGRYRRERPAPFVADESLVQLLLTSPDRGYLSITRAPGPYELRHSLSFAPGGDVPLAVDKQAPSRAFAKLVESEYRMGRRISGGESCVDLGASPGSWTYVAARRGARVTAVDRAELRADLMHARNVAFERGDAFRFAPPSTVDWLLCDVIAAADRSAELLLTWLRERRCRHFVVTLKVDDAGSLDVLAALKRELPALASEFWLLRLTANKKEVCCFGSVEAAARAAPRVDE